MVLFHCAAWRWRSLAPAETDFVIQHFGERQGRRLVAHARLGKRRLGDTRRALCLNGGRISLPGVCFEAGDATQVLRLHHPQVAGMFAHELLHVLQRELGMAVTRQTLLLQGTYFLAGRNPYLYRTSANARQMLRHFWAGNVEQQAQMWQDHVQAQVAGQSLPGHALLAQAVRHGRLRSRRPV